MRNDTPWFKCWPAEVPKHIEYPKVPLQEILKKTAEVYPEKTAIVYGEQEISYSKLEVLSNQFANALVKVKVDKGEKNVRIKPKRFGRPPKSQTKQKSS